MTGALILLATARKRSALSASASPAASNVAIFAGWPSGLVASDTIGVTPSGGVAPYTYSWALLSGFAMTISNPTNAASYFSATVPGGVTRSAVYRCTVTDAASATATVDVPIDLTNESSS